MARSGVRPPSSPNATTRTTWSDSEVGWPCSVYGGLIRGRAASDGERLWAFRYSSEGKSRSLFYSRDIRTLRELYPERQILQQLSSDARMVLTEPVGDLPGA